jgi:F0F1-type ATP synthase assembly protein I
MPKEEPDPKKKSRLSADARKYLALTDIAFRMIATIVLGVFLGKKIDQWLQLEQPWGIICLGLISLALAMYQVIQRLK